MLPILAIMKFIHLPPLLKLAIFIARRVPTSYNIQNLMISEIRVIYHINVYKKFKSMTLDCKKMLYNSQWSELFKKTKL